MNSASPFAAAAETLAASTQALQLQQRTTLAGMVAPLAAIAKAERSFSCDALVQCVARLQECRAMLAARQPAEESLADQERTLATWLTAYLAGATGTPGIVRQDLLEDQLVASNIVAPFVHAGEHGNARFGVPTNVTPDLLCDNISELLRMAAAALLTLFTYLNFTQTSQDLPPDEVVLIFATIAINSCADADSAAIIDRQLATLFSKPSASEGQQEAQQEAQQQQQQQQQEAQQQQEQQQLEQRAASSSSAAAALAAAQHPLPPDPSGLRCKHIRWLMHWARSVIAHHMGSVAYVLNDKERQGECYTAQHKDQQYMVGSLPNHPLGYSLYSRTCMTFQHMAAAAAFLTRGLRVAKAANDDACVAAMSFQLAAAILLGGRGPEFEADEVLALMADGEEARASVLSWWPETWAGSAMDGEPDRTLLITRLLPEVEKRSGSRVEAGAKLPALEGLLYVTAPPKSLPPGALVQQSAEQQEPETAVRASTS